MTSHALRLYAAAVTLLVFFVLWAVVAAKPWASTGGHAALDPRIAALDRRQRRLQREARVVKQTLDRRWREYRQRLREREARIRTLERRHAAQVAAVRAAAARLRLRTDVRGYGRRKRSSGGTGRHAATAGQGRDAATRRLARRELRELPPMRDVASAASGRTIGHAPRASV